MDLTDLKVQHIRTTLGISEAAFPRIVSFIDFGNVNYLFTVDDKDENGDPLTPDKRLSIDLEKLKSFLSLFSKDIRFYYGHNPSSEKSLAFLQATRYVFGKYRVFTKPIQNVRHYLDDGEAASNQRLVTTDANGDYIFIPKCNFDVEISVDAIRLADSYDTICLLSSDADFVSLFRYLKSRGKKIVLIKGGHISGALGAIVDLKINAQDIKKHLTVQKQKPGSS